MKINKKKAQIAVCIALACQCLQGERQILFEILIFFTFCTHFSQKHKKLRFS